jgi:hypothetical protein
MGILDGVHVRYDPAHALLLTSAFGFEPGERFLLEQAQSVDLLIRRHIEGGDEQGIFRILRREGRKDPDLYVQVLTYFVQKAGRKMNNNNHVKVSEEEDEEERWDAVMEVLTAIEKANVLSSVQVRSS